MSNFKKSIDKFSTCEIHTHGKAAHFAKLDNGSWVAVNDDGSLDWCEMSSNDFGNMLESLESVGARVVFTNHSAI